MREPTATAGSAETPAAETADAETADAETADAETATRRVERFLRRVVLLGAPIAMLAASLRHPETGHHDPAVAFLPVAGRYLGVHLLLVPAGALLAVGLYSLVSRARGTIALLSRIAVAVFGFLIVAYSSIAGLAAGIVMIEAPAGTEAATLEPLVNALFVSPIPVLMAMLAIFSYLVAVVAVAVVLRRRGAPLPALVAMVASTVAIYNHLGTTGVVGMGLYLVAVAWLEFGWESDASTAGEEAGVTDS